MSLLKSEDNKKWINFFVAVVSIFVGFLVIRFSAQMSEWFDLEAKVSHFKMVAQAVGIFAGLTVFLLVQKSREAGSYLNQVYVELVKVIWPDSESVAKSTVGIVVGLAIMSGIFVGVDTLFRAILNLIY